MSGVDRAAVSGDVTTSFAYPCGTCGRTVHVADTREQPHDCDPTGASLTRAWWNGHDHATNPNLPAAAGYDAPVLSAPQPPAHSGGEPKTTRAAKVDRAALIEAAAEAMAPLPWARSTAAATAAVDAVLPLVAQAIEDASTEGLNEGDFDPGMLRRCSPGLVSCRGRTATMTRCCEHNRCPDRPKHFLGRFQTRPWRCPQCGQFWVTVPWYGYEFAGYRWAPATPVGDGS